MKFDYLSKWIDSLHLHNIKYTYGEVVISMSPFKVSSITLTISAWSAFTTLSFLYVLRAFAKSSLEISYFFRIRVSFASYVLISYPRNFCSTSYGSGFEDLLAIVALIPSEKLIQFA